MGLHGLDVNALILRLRAEGQSPFSCSWRPPALSFLSQLSLKCHLLVIVVVESAFEIRHTTSRD